MKIIFARQWKESIAAVLCRLTITPQNGFLAAELVLFLGWIAINIIF